MELNWCPIFIKRKLLQLNFFPYEIFPDETKETFSRVQKKSSGTNSSTKDLGHCCVERYPLIPKPIKLRSETCATWKWWQGTLQKDSYWYAWHTLIYCQEQKMSLRATGAQDNVALVYIVIGWVMWSAVLLPNRVHKAWFSYAAK